jgi:uncharacterized RDD family membrane protein YckC
MLSLSAAAIESVDQGKPVEGVGFGLRALARMIDSGVQIVCILAATFVASLLLAIGAAVRGADPEQEIARLGDGGLGALLASLAGAWAYHVIGEWLHGSTLGKRVCGITVIDERGGAARFVGVMKRNLAYFLDSMFFGLIAYQRMQGSPRQQRIGDAWGETMVVRIASQDPAERRGWGRFALGVVASVTAVGLGAFLELAARAVLL